ncbi:hypothetical protein QTI66_31780 [Variovorax sp. J22R133]|uniref:hypothetical protein n=1 Tax=Variovorax brevis TaxID=3053503 RepID=UPI0025776C6B|nr:hypothetical protein [Variovorax sp. J22R133]MDM0116719.1 hypothetical protein [Variovorax sp. J22R133]
MPEQVLEFFKFYEEVAERTKGHAWAQSTWVLTLNGAVLGFSLNLFVQSPSVRGLLLIECLSALAGVVLSAYIAFVLSELGDHIQRYWTAANKLALQSKPLSEYIGTKETEKARHEFYKADFPRFIKRLMWPPGFFVVAHLSWAIYVGAVMCCTPGK